jgi:acyl dehydratase
VPINPNTPTGVWSHWTERAWTSADAILYAIGVGAGSLHPTDSELEFTTENSKDVPQRTLPTFPVVLGPVGASLTSVGPFSMAMLVDGGRKVVLHREVPVDGHIRSRGRLTGIYDKGSGAVVATESESVDAESGDPLFSLYAQFFIRGEGGFGGDRGPSGPRNAPPERAPDHEVTYQTRPDQALTYRLSGDRNPLHADPEFAKAAGFPRPILHGLCTYGFTGRALLHALCDSDPARFASMEGRFSSVVYPGDQLTVSIWGVADGEAIFTTTNQDGQLVIDQGMCTFTK